MARKNSGVILSLFLALVLICMLALSGCGSESSSGASESAGSESSTSEKETGTERNESTAESGKSASVAAGTYTYVDTDPEYDSEAETGQICFDYMTDTLSWAYDADGSTEKGSETISGDLLRFFQSVYLSDTPVTDWFGGAEKDTEGYAGDVAGNVEITFTGDGRISEIYVASPTTRVNAVVTGDIVDTTLTIRGSTSGQPQLMQSCITLLGSTNALYLSAQGDVIMDNLEIGNDGEEVGLTADKIGGDTFVVGTVTVDGKVEWHNKMGVITALSTEPGLLETNGQDISMTGGSNIGRVGRELTISTGESLGGDIYLGKEVTTDSTRGGLIPNADTSSDGVTISTSGSIIAGKGNVVVGTNTEMAVSIDVIGDIQAANVTIDPTDYGEVADVSGTIGNITADENIEIVVGDVKGEITTTSEFSSTEGTVEQEVVSRSSNPEGVLIGNLTSENGNISLTAGVVSGNIGSVSAPKGIVTLDVASADNLAEITEQAGQ